MKDVLLFSGGMDSLIAWEYLHRPDTMYIKMNHRYQYPEYAIAEQFLDTIVNMPALGEFEKKDAEIPMRNLYFAMLAANTGYDKIWIIAQEDEMSIPDRTEEFYRKSSEIISMLMGRYTHVDTPFRHMDKTDMVAWYKENDHSIEALKNTWACYTPPKGFPVEHCGNCPACFRRWVAMKLNGINEEWHIKIKDSVVMEDYRKKALAGFYSEKRNRRILQAIGDL